MTRRIEDLQAKIRTVEAGLAVARRSRHLLEVPAWKELAADLRNKVAAAVEQSLQRQFQPYEQGRLHGFVAAVRAMVQFQAVDEEEIRKMETALGDLQGELKELQDIGYSEMESAFSDPRGV